VVNQLDMIIWKTMIYQVMIMLQVISKNIYIFLYAKNNCLGAYVPSLLLNRQSQQISWRVFVNARLRRNDYAILPQVLTKIG